MIYRDILQTHYSVDLGFTLHFQHLAPRTQTKTLQDRAIFIISSLVDCCYYRYESNFMSWISLFSIFDSISLVSSPTYSESVLNYLETRLSGKYVCKLLNSTGFDFSRVLMVLNCFHYGMNDFY
jgi:hypothetical protein